MFELQELRKKIKSQDYIGALKIVDELEEMSLDDKINKIESYIIILLLHLIKQQAEKRSTSSWERSINNSVRGIKKTNKRRKAGGYYVNNDLITDLLKENLEDAIKEASYEAFEGKLTSEQLKTKFDSKLILSKAFDLLKE